MWQNQLPLCNVSLHTEPCLLYWHIACNAVIYNGAAVPRVLVGDITGRCESVNTWKLTATSLFKVPLCETRRRVPIIAPPVEHFLTIYWTIVQSYRCGTEDTWQETAACSSTVHRMCENKRLQHEHQLMLNEREKMGHSSCLKTFSYNWCQWLWTGWKHHSCHSTLMLSLLTKKWVMSPSNKKTQKTKTTSAFFNNETPSCDVHFCLFPRLLSHMMAHNNREAHYLHFLDGKTRGHQCYTTAS